MSRATLLAAACALAAAAPASGFDLKSAIASAQPGETVVVPSGVHAGPVVVTRAVTLASSNCGLRGM